MERSFRTQCNIQIAFQIVSTWAWCRWCWNDVVSMAANIETMLDQFGMLSGYLQQFPFWLNVFWINKCRGYHLPTLYSKILINYPLHIQRPKLNIYESPCYLLNTIQSRFVNSLIFILFIYLHSASVIYFPYTGLPWTQWVFGQTLY